MEAFIYDRHNNNDEKIIDHFLIFMSISRSVITTLLVLGRDDIDDIDDTSKPFVVLMAVVMNTFILINY